MATVSTEGTVLFYHMLSPTNSYNLLRFSESLKLLKRKGNTSLWNLRKTVAIISLSSFQLLYMISKLCISTHNNCFILAKYHISLAFSFLGRSSVKNSLQSKAVCAHQWASYRRKKKKKHCGWLKPKVIYISSLSCKNWKKFLNAKALWDSPECTFWNRRGILGQI